jgi:hypothetical protein
MTLGNHRQSWDVTKAAIAIAGDNTDKFINFVILNPIYKVLFS